jgi:hypothetical protein
MGKEREEEEEEGNVNCMKSLQVEAPSWCLFPPDLYFPVSLPVFYPVYISLPPSRKSHRMKIMNEKKNAQHGMFFLRLAVSKTHEE